MRWVRRVLLGLIVTVVALAGLGAAKAFNASTKYMATNAAELLAIPETSAQARSAGSLGDRPLIVLTAVDSFDGLPTELATRTEQAWEELQAELAALSAHSLHRVLEGTTHTSLVYNREDAQSTIAAILQVAEAARTRRFGRSER